jgi:hypothetical protein
MKFSLKFGLVNPPSLTDSFWEYHFNIAFTVSSNLAARPLDLHSAQLLLVVVACILILLIGSLDLLPPHAAWAATAERRGEGEIDMLLRVEADDERRNIDDLLANTSSGE